MPRTNVIFKYQKYSVRSIVFNQFKSPLILILFIASLVTFVLGDYLDSIVIMGTMLLNAALGFYQEYKAQDTLYHLKKLLKPTAVVIRNGKREELDAEFVEKGDTAIVSKELSIPADGKLTEGKDLFVNEAILTGESFPVRKAVGDMLYAGTTIISGLGKIQIVETGLKTKVGSIGKFVLEQQDETTPLQKQIGEMGKLLSIIIPALACLIFIIGLAREYEIEELVKTVVAVAVASIPEGLVITMTVILTVGMQRILERKAIVRRLIAAETLGAVNIICADKTGTITEGKLSVAGVSFIDKKLGMSSLLLCNNLVDPLEVAMAEWYEKNKNELPKEYLNLLEAAERLDQIPFSNDHKYTATLNRIGEKKYLFVFGAPENVESLCIVKGAQTDPLWSNRIREEGEKAHKVVALAVREFSGEKLTLKDVHGLHWNGIVSFNDPVRAGIKETIRDLHKAGIEVKMITGDYLYTAMAVAKQAGLLPRELDADVALKYILQGEEIEKLEEQELKLRVFQCRLFARINPLQKLKIVEILRSEGNVTAMTGDGVNDAPALKNADIGIVVNEASDISKNTADMVLLDSNLKTIAFAVKVGRGLFDNIRKVVLYLVGGSFGEIFLILFSYILGLPLPLTPLQLLWINLVEDTSPALALAFEKEGPEVMRQRPRSSKEPILNKKLFKLLFTFVITSNVILLIYYLALLQLTNDQRLIQTVLFVSFGFKALLFVYAIRDFRTSVFTHNPFTNWRLNAAVILGIVLYFVALNVPFFNEALNTVPLGIEYILIAAVLGIANVLLVEIIKSRLKLHK